MTRWLLALALALPLVGATLAFPGAEGFGAATPGGRGGRVFIVTTLADSGPGSFREACGAQGPRTIVFAVSGIIDLKRPLQVTEPFLTVAAQTAPGDGVCLRGGEFSIKTHDVIVRFLRSRPGDILRQEMDAINVVGDSQNVILDHCSASWSVDEALSPSGGISGITVQWCLIGESLDKGVHSKGSHGYGSLARAVGGVTFHHNLWVKNVARNPRLGDNYGKPPYPTFDVRNNVMALWGAICSGMTGDQLSANYADNYLKPGPDSSARPPIVLTNTARVRYFVAGNLVEGRPQFDANGETLFTPSEFEGRKLFELVERPFAAPPVTTTSARQAYEDVMERVGATVPRRDAVDQRIIAEVRAGRGRIINSQTEVGGWPNYQPAKPPKDTDSDGMPDAWERAHGLNPRDPKDAILDRDHDGYTNLEEYLNELAAKSVRPR